MSLRVRLGLAAGIAVAVAVLAVAVSAYAGTRSVLRGQLDDSLRAIDQPLLARAQGPPGEDGDDGGSLFSTAPGSSAPPGAAAGGDCDEGLGIDERGAPRLGAASGYVQLVRTDGQLCLASDELVSLPVSARIRQLARSNSKAEFFTDLRTHSTELRVLVAGVGQRGALMTGLSLADVHDALRRQVALLALIAAAGVALAGLLALLVARTALAPIRRFTAQTEQIARQPERLEDQRLDVHGGDELARLAATFNVTLDALAAAVQAQRNLVADASHELRTPMASIRANLQLMRDEHLLTPQDREALRADVIAELDELTALVADVVELARGGRLAGEPGDLRLDVIVEAALSRARRRAPQLAFAASLEATIVRGDEARVARAVNNLLDNAIKWSPVGEAVEVSLRSGILTVRDHGPGFAPDELPFVFDRFHRAKDARAKPGSGLGLAIVRQAAEAHGGRAEAANAPGGGAILRVSFGEAQSLATIGRRAAPADQS